MTTKVELPKVERRYANTLLGGLGGRTRRECWRARTVDGVWDIERLDEPGTPWIVTHLPTARQVPLLVRFSHEPWRSIGPKEYGSLRKALVDIATGRAARLFEMEGTFDEFVAGRDG